MGHPCRRARPVASALAVLGLALAWACAAGPSVAGGPGGGLMLHLVDADGAPVPGAVASLHDGEGGSLLAVDRPVHKAVIEQTRGEFSPALTVVEVGTPVRFPNLDRIRHHVYSFSSAKTFELPLYSGEPHEPVVFDAPGIVTLGCNIHDWMLAHVLVMDTPWHAVSGADGRVGLAPPPGAYRLRVWHPGLPAGQGVLEQAFVVDGTPQVLDLVLDLSRPPLRRLRGEAPRTGEYE